MQYDIAKVTADRWVGLLKTNAVSREIAEQDVATMKALAATLAAAQANVQRLSKLQSYEKVIAPFAGVVTARNIDVGALIDSGSAGGSKMELFHLAETDKLRVFVDVPQVYAQDMQPGVPATLTLPQWPGRPLHGAVARTSGAINSASRTLRVEVDVDNQDGAVLPGAYALVDLDVTASHPLLSVPVNTLLFRPNGGAGGGRRWDGQGAAANGYLGTGLRHDRGSDLRARRERARHRQPGRCHRTRRRRARRRESVRRTPS